MADPNTRQGKRTPVTLKIKFKSETLEQFIERYAVDVSQGGIFIRTKEPLQVGTQMKFEFQLRDASPLIAGEGTVVWTRENDPSRPAIAPGMGVRFDRLAEGSQSVLEKILAEKAKQAPQRGGESSTKPPMFTDTPTRVAPAPVQDALLGTKSGRTRADSEQTPLPKPMPFHSDADEFGAEAFEEATKVRALDELVAQTAEADPKTAIMPPDELAARRRAETPLAEPPLPDDRMKTVEDRDSAPGLPSPPEPSGRKLLDTTPSPRPTGSTTPPMQSSLPPATDLSAKTRLGLEPAKAPTLPPRNVETTERVAAPRAVAAEPSRPTASSRPSAAPVVIGILVVVAAAMAAVWYFVLRDNVAEEVAQKRNPTPGSNAVGSATGSAGSAAVATGSGSAGSAEVKPAGPTVETEIASNVAKATVSVVDGDQTGPAPFKAKLEKDRMYKVRVEAPGYLAVELDVKGGQDKVTAKLVAKPHVLALATEPPGAQIYIDNAPTGKVTPFELELTAAQAAKPKIHVQLRKAGFRPVDQMVDMATGWSDEEARVVEKIDSRLAVMVMINTNNGGNTTHTNTNNGSNTTHTNAGSGSGAGSAAANTGTGTGSATSGTGTGSAATGHEGSASTGGGAGSASPTGAGTGSASTGTPSSSGGSKTGSGSEPEPDWSKKSP